MANLHLIDKAMMRVDDGYGSTDSSFIEDCRSELRSLFDFTFHTMFHQDDQPSQSGEIESSIPYATLEETPNEGKLLKKTRSNFGLCLACLLPERFRGNESSEQTEELEREIMQLDDLITKLDDLSMSLKEQLLRMKKDVLTESQQNQRIPYFIRFQLPIVAGVQILWVTLLLVFDSILKTMDPNYEKMVNAIMLVLHLVNVLHVGLATVALTRQLLKYKSASGYLMAQTYLSTVLLFAGVYLIIYRFSPNSWELASNDVIHEGNTFIQYIRMLYLSVSSATLCGAANIQPRSWFAIVFVCCQSLINFVYFASILAQTIGNYGSSSTAVIQRRERLETLRMSLKEPTSLITSREAS